MTAFHDLWLAVAVDAGFCGAGHTAARPGHVPGQAPVSAQSKFGPPCGGFVCGVIDIWLGLLSLVML